MSAAYSWVLVTAGCGRPSAVHPRGRRRCIELAGLGFLFCSVRLRSKAACAASPLAAAALEDATRTFRAALRPGQRW